MKNKLEDLRNHLFATLEALQDPDKPMELDRAKAVAEVAGVLVASAKVEVDFLRVTERTDASNFFPEPIRTINGRPLAAIGGRKS